MDEHRIGLKPILRRVWAPKGERPIALGHHRYEWLYVWGFVEPASGATVWNVSNAVCKEMFEAILADFAKSAGAGESKRIVLQLDGAGWHVSHTLAPPDNLTLINLPPYAPELNPIENVWEYLRKNKLALRVHDSYEAIVEACCTHPLIEWRGQLRRGSF